MTVEELLIPRYKVIADYPNIQFKIGDIVKKYFFDISQKGAYTYLTNVKSPLQGSSLKREYIETMPHLFKKLEWWEERIKSDFTGYVCLQISKRYFKVLDVLQDGKLILDIHELENKYFNTFAYNFSPATEEQYKEYLRTK
jgi:hypothetical protein